MKKRVTKTKKKASTSRGGGRLSRAQVQNLLVNLRKIFRVKGKK